MVLASPWKTGNPELTMSPASLVDLLAFIEPTIPQSCGRGHLKAPAEHLVMCYSIRIISESQRTVKRAAGKEKIIGGS